MVPNCSVRGGKRRCRRTSISNLTGIATRGTTSPLRERSPDLSETLGSRPRPDALVLRQHHLLDIPLGIRNLGLDGHNLVHKRPLILRLLGTLEALGGVLVHLLPGDAEIPAHVLGCPAHGLHAVAALLGVGCHGLVEGLVERVTAGGHGLGADGDADFDAAGRDLVCDVGRGLEARGAEAVDGGGTARVGEAGG